MPSVGQQKGLVGIRLLPQGLEETVFGVRLKIIFGVEARFRH